MESAKILTWVLETRFEGQTTYGELATALTKGYVAIQREPRLLRLTDIYLPESETHQGWGSKILDALEVRSHNAGVRLVVGPLLTGEDDEGEELPNYPERMVVARGYQPYPPFSAIAPKRA